jgi:predicted amidohydrolase
MSQRLEVAMIREVFSGPDAEARLRERLSRARAAGAELALLPELPLHPWRPATQEVEAEDAEPMGGARQSVLCAAARATGIGLVGGAIVCDAAGRRFNTAVVVNASGEVVSRYRKLHLPEEDGFWETSHYEPGDEAPQVIRAFGVPLAVTLCSDVNRPELAHILASAGAQAILAPRATEAATFERWRLVMRATALTTASYVLSVPRPEPEAGVPLGGPSVAIGPDGDVILETTEPLASVGLDCGAIERVRRRYPGYLAVRSDIYAAAWRTVTPTTRPHQRTTTLD